jgi:5-oxoprolinase (ATP-hydrolysing) subunit A
VITANDGTLLAVDVSSICVHGDTPGAVAIASAVRHALTHEGIELRSFAA